MIFGLYHASGETVGLVGDSLKELKLPFTEVHLHDGDGLPRETSDLSGLIVMGGPMNVDQVNDYPFLLPEVQLIEKVIADQKPVLGICLGAQLIAKALDSRVYPNQTKEVGWHSIELTEQAGNDDLFNKLPNSIEVLHWHGDTFDLPQGAVLLAKSARCENQAFRWGKNVYGLQFHLEVTPSMLKEWCHSEESRAYIKSAGENKDGILKAAPSAFKKLLPTARRFFTDYLKSAFRSPLPVS